jgi:hypothetical protein
VLFGVEFEGEFDDVVVLGEQFVLGKESKVEESKVEGEKAVSE